MIRCFNVSKSPLEVFDGSCKELGMEFRPETSPETFSTFCLSLPTCRALDEWRHRSDLGHVAAVVELLHQLDN